MDAVGVLEHALTPGAQEVAVAVKHYHRVLAAVEGVDVVVVIDSHRGNVGEGPTVGQLGPVIAYFVAVLAFAENDGHERVSSVE